MGKIQPVTMKNFFKRQFLNGFVSALSIFVLFQGLCISFTVAFLTRETYIAFKDEFYRNNVELPLLTNIFISIPLFLYYFIFALIALLMILKEFLLKDRKRALKQNLYYALLSLLFIVFFIIVMYLPMFGVLSKL